jgi:iron-sulfur cluster assembly accessory protein
MITISPENDFPIEITPKAIYEIKEALKYDSQDKLRVGVLRIAIQGGGCSGLQYKLDIDNNSRSDDYTLEVEEGVTIVIDGHSAIVLRGSILDYHTSLTTSGFKFENPQAKKTCGCGSSFGY